MYSQFAYKGKNVSKNYENQRANFCSSDENLLNLNLYIFPYNLVNRWENKATFYKYNNSNSGDKYFGIIVDKLWDNYITNENFIFQGFAFQCDEYGRSLHEDFYDAEWEGAGAYGSNMEQIRKGVMYDIYHFQLANNQEIID
jgi:hypothetical protein